MVLLLKSIVSILQLVLCSAACAVTWTPKFHHITRPILKSLYWQTMNQKIQYKVLAHSQLYKKKMVTNLVFTPFSHSQFNVSLVLHLLSRVIVLLSLLVSKFQTDHSITSLLSHGMVWPLTSHLIHDAHHSTSSSTTFGSCISDLSTSHFLKNWSPSSSAFLFLFTTCILTWPTLGQIYLVLTFLSLLNSL